MSIYSSAFSQSMEGSYANTWESEKGSGIRYSLLLNPDKTFIFESNRFYASSTPSKVETVKGLWKKRHRLLILKTKGIANDHPLAKKLHKNKAKLKVYSKRHKNYGKVKPSLKFYRSKVFYAKGMRLIKKEEDIATN